MRKSVKSVIRFWLRPFFLALCIAGCGRSSPTVRLQWTVMGTIAAVQCPTRAEAESVKAICQRIFAEQERIFSVWDAGSVVSSVNQAAGGDAAVPVPDHFRTVLECALEMHRRSEGAFNPLLAPVLRLWGFLGSNRKGVPGDDEIAKASALTDCRDIKFDGNGCLLAKKGMALDLGAIAKGYAVDVAFDAVKQAGFEIFLIDLGGNIRVSGNPHSDCDGWVIGVRDPHSPRAVAKTVRLSSGEAVATSADYERFRIIDGKRYGHIIDPRSGRPALGRACSVKADNAMVADGLSTALYILDDEKGEALLESFTAKRLY